MSTQQAQRDVQGYYQLDPFRDFLKSEGIPIVEDYSVDCLTLPLEPWARLGGRGAYVNLTGRGDFCSVYVAEVPPGGQLNPERHLHDEVIHVVAGRGATTVELPGGAKHTFEWGAGSLFAIPLNARHQHFNGSGLEPARFAAITNLPIYLNLTHNVDFVFSNPFEFHDRAREERYFRGEGEFLPVRPGRHQWETVFVPDLAGFTLPEWKERGAGGHNINFVLAESTVQGHISEFPSGTYKKAHRHGAGAHIWCVTGHGYSLLWKEGEDPTATKRVDWKPGVLFAPPDGPTYHQHFNTAPYPARYLALYADGSRYPVLDSNRGTTERMDVSVKLGGDQVEYEDEDPRILRLFEAECARSGVPPRMRELRQHQGPSQGRSRATFGPHRR
jgi:mannose-6-phosphate isomerase-like protein (cupin superfamily)